MDRDTGHRMKRRRLANCMYTLTRTPLQHQRGLPIFTAAHFPTSDFLREYTLCSFEEEERQENDDQAKRGHSSIPDRGG